MAILGYTAATTTLPTLALVSLGVFVLSALGGATIFTLYHLREKPLPIPLMLEHAAIAIVGVALLLLAMVQ